MNQKAELERFLIHCVIVAGKTATFGNTKTEALLSDSGGLSPFEHIRRLSNEGKLLETLKNAKTGNYTKMLKCFETLVNANLNLETCSVQDLEQIPYIGLKTSRYFLMYTRPEHQTNDIAVIDTHALKWCRKDPWAIERLRQLGVTRIPKGTPGKSAKRVYMRIQQAICEDARRKNMTAREWDSTNWDEESRYSDLSRARALASTATG